MMRSTSTVILEISVLILLFANAVVSQDFVILEPQTRTYNMNENVTVWIYHDLEEVQEEELIVTLNCTDYELGKGYLSIELTSVIHNLNGLAELGYKVVGYGRDNYYFDRWTLQRRVYPEQVSDKPEGNSANVLECFSKMFSLLIPLMLLLNKGIM